MKIYSLDLRECVYHKQRYGTRRLWAELQAQGYRIGRQRLQTELRRC